MVASAAGDAERLVRPGARLRGGLYEQEAFRDRPFRRQARHALGDGGTSRATYEHDGRSGDIDLLLWPVNFTLAYVGYAVLAPFVAYGVEAGLRYSDTAAVEDRLRAIVADFRAAVPRLAERETIPFNRMEEWGPDGRIAPEAPVHSPFIRRKPRLVLE